LQAEFEEVFGEPEGTFSPDCAWKCGFMCYQGARKCCYAFSTVISTWCAGLFWGCFYALVSCCMIWWVTPSLKVYNICLRCCAGYITACCECTLTPACSAYGSFFSRIKVTQG